MDKKNALVVFQNKKIRRVWHNDEWYFSIIDIIVALDVSTRPRKYWSDLKKYLTKEGFEVSEIIGQLKLIATDGKKYATDCANTKNIFRIIQSVPSKKAEPLKQWLAKVGYERIQEIEDPELAQERMKRLYELKGYSKEWIDKRLRGIAIRLELTNEWKNRDVNENVEFAILTNEISKATFGKTVEEYKKYKKLNKENLRDHMGDLELIFTMLGEKVTTKITKKEDKNGLDECSDAAKRGGKIAGNARKETERELDESIVSNENYLDEPESTKRKSMK